MKMWFKCACILWLLGVSSAGAAPLPVEQYKTEFSAPPSKTPASHSIDAPLMGNGDTLVALGGGPSKLQFYINKNDLWVMKREEGSHPVPLARLDLELPELQGASYHVEQDLLRAVTSGRFAQKSRALTIETAVAATENLLWIRLSAEGGTIAGRATLSLPGAGATGSVERATGVQVVERRFEQGMMTPAGAACAMRAPGGSGEFTVKPGAPVLLVAAVCSRFDSDDFRAAAVKRAADVSGKRLRAITKAHEAWWREFWSKSFVEIPDKVLEQRYYLSQYVLASASRALSFPPGLFGWVTTDQPDWNGDYHMNYNHVAPFYGLYAANHMEQADPCHVPILDSIRVGHEWCLKEWGIKDGILLPVGIGPKGSLADRNLWGQKSNAAYCCVPLAFRWYATYDLDFAKKAYPFVLGTARFWDQSLALENGRYVIYKDAIHEGSGENVNPILTLGLVRMVMGLALDMSAELGVDADRRAKWKDILDRLSDYPACALRDLPQQFWPAHLPQDEATLSLPIFRYTEQGMPWCEGNTLGIQHIYPAGAIGLDSKPELLQRARNQVRVMSRWKDGNGMNSFYAAAARVGYDPVTILREMRAMLAVLALPNGMIRDNPHGMEHHSIVPNAIQEMLLQSHEGALRVFPCWPKDQDARFGTLRARGAFLVSAELKGGVVGGVRIASEKGRPCTVVNPWPGEDVCLIRGGRIASTLSGERFTFKTKVNDGVELRPCNKKGRNM